MSDVGLRKAAAFAVPAILLVVGGFYAIVYAIAALIGLPPSLGFPLAVRVVGGVLVLLGLAVGGWVFSYRSATSMMVSTYITVWSASLCLWFWLILIPFEEGELRALFGKQYEEYADAVPMIVPFTKRRKGRPSPREVIGPGQA